MKIQIDSSLKTIKVQENTNFKKLYEMLKALPEDIFGDWKEYSIEANTTIMWNNYPWYYVDYNSGKYLSQTNYEVTCYNAQGTNTKSYLSDEKYSKQSTFNFELT